MASNHPIHGHRKVDSNHTTHGHGKVDPNHTAHGHGKVDTNHITYGHGKIGSNLTETAPVPWKTIVLTGPSTFNHTTVVGPIATLTLPPNVSIDDLGHDDCIANPDNQLCKYIHPSSTPSDANDKHKKLKEGWKNWRKESMLTTARLCLLEMFGPLGALLQRREPKFISAANSTDPVALFKPPAATGVQAGLYDSCRHTNHSAACDDNDWALQKRKNPKKPKEPEKPPLPKASHVPILVKGDDTEIYEGLTIMSLFLICGAPLLPFMNPVRKRSVEMSEDQTIMTGGGDSPAEIPTATVLAVVGAALFFVLVVWGVKRCRANDRRVKREPVLVF